MSGAVVGFYGKLPTHGDFLTRRVADGFRETWDGWLQRCVARSQEDLGDRWLDCYLTSPMWRFFLSEGIAGPMSYAGVLLPSVDRVGRYFPLTVVAELPAGTPALAFSLAAARWFADIETLCARALEDAQSDLDSLDAALAATAERLAGLDSLPAPGVFPGGSGQWHWPARAMGDLAAALAPPLMTLAQGALRPLAMWWTDGSAHVQPCVLLTRSLPRPESFAALLAGTWENGYWDGEVAAQPPGGDWSEAPANLATASAGATDAGPVRSQNQDAYALCDGNRVWAVADGMGGYRDGDVASRMVVDALQALEPTASLNAALQSIDVALSRVNADLRRSALGVGGGGMSGSTVVVLVVRGGEFAVSWAGDSRAYLQRQGTLSQLTRDHALAEPAAVGAVPGEITRAVGGDETLELDCVADRLAPGDRFLLCSDGLYRTLDPATLAQLLRQGTPAEASRALIQAACGAGARDNVTAVIIDVEEAYEH
jgi:type VI secretion system protein ImpM